MCIFREKLTPNQSKELNAAATGIRSVTSAKTTSVERQIKSAWSADGSFVQRVKSAVATLGVDEDDSRPEEKIKKNKKIKKIDKINADDSILSGM